MISKVSRRYSLALFEASRNLNILDKIFGEVTNFISLIHSARSLELFFLSPSIRSEKKIVIIGYLFSNDLNPLLMNFIKLVITKSRESLILDILNDFIDLTNEKAGKIPVNIKTVIELDDKAKAEFKQKVDNYIKLDSIPTYQTDDSLIGGFTVKMNDNIIDASIKRQLELLKQKLNEGIIS